MQILYLAEEGCVSNSGFATMCQCVKQKIPSHQKSVFTCTKELSEGSNAARHACMGMARGRRTTCARWPPRGGRHARGLCARARGTATRARRPRPPRRKSERARSLRSRRRRPKSMVLRATREAAAAKLKWPLARSTCVVRRQIKRREGETAERQKEGKAVASRMGLLFGLMW